MKIFISWYEGDKIIRKICYPNSITRCGNGFIIKEDNQKSKNVDWLFYYTDISINNPYVFEIDNKLYYMDSQYMTEKIFHIIDTTLTLEKLN